MTDRSTEPVTRATPAAIRGIDRMDPNELAAALLGLGSHRGGDIWVVVDPMPSGPANATRHTVRPTAVWRRLFATAGFTILDERTDPSAAEHGDTWSARRHWQRLRPWRDDEDRAPRSFLLRREGQPVADDAGTHLRALLGVRPTCAVPPALVDADTHVVFLVGTYQEFRQYLPLWPQLPRERVSVLLRETRRADNTVDHREACMKAWLRGRGIAAHAVDDVPDIDWRQWPQRRRALVCGADSTAYDVHLWNAAVVVAAKRHHFATVQLQHGIWPYADQQEPMTVLSDRVLTWSREFEHALAEVVTWPDGTTGPRAVMDGVHFVTTGCPVFDRYADPSPARLEDLLGNWVSRYRQRVLVATNLHWSQHARGGQVYPALLNAARLMPDTLFVVKLHPVHDVDDAFLAASPDNIIVLDELCCLFADIDSTRLVRAVDAVVATQSTVALEAALADRPLVVLDTGNPNRYEHVLLTPPDRLAEDVASALAAPPDTRAFRDHYFDSSQLGRGTETTLNAIAAALEVDERRAPSRNGIALHRFSTRLSTYAADLASAQAGLAAAEARLGDVEARLQRLTTDAASVTPVTDARDTWLLQARGDRRTRVLLFGAGSAGREWLRTIRCIAHLEPIAFADSDPARHGTTVDGLRIEPPTPDVLTSADLIVISSMHVAPIVAVIAATGCADRILADNRALERVADQARVPRAS